MRRGNRTKRKLPKRTKRPKRTAPKRSKREKYSKKYTKKRVKRNLRRNYSIYIGGNPLEAGQTVVRTSDESAMGKVIKLKGERARVDFSESGGPATSWVNVNDLKLPHIEQVVALYDYSTTREGVFNMHVGENFIVIDQSAGPHWIKVKKGDITGLVPANHVKKIYLHPPSPGPNMDDMMYILPSKRSPVEKKREQSRWCTDSHYKKMGINDDNIEMLRLHNLQGTRPSNSELEKLYDRNKDMGVSFNRLNQKLQDRPVVLIATHGTQGDTYYEDSLLSDREPINLQEFETHIINFTHSGSNLIQNNSQVRQTDEGVLTNLNNDLFNFLQHIVGNEDITEEAIAKYHFFKPGKELTNGSGPEVQRNFHYVPVCESRMGEILMRDKYSFDPIYLITSDCRSHKGNVFRNTYYWKNPKVYGEGKASEIMNTLLSWNSNEMFTDFKDHNKPNFPYVKSKTTKPGFYIFNHSLNPDDLNNLMECLHTHSKFYNKDNELFNDKILYKSAQGSIDGLEYLHIYTTSTDLSYNVKDSSYYYESFINYKDMLTCFKEFFKGSFTTIDTICRSSSNISIGDDTSDLARMISTGTMNPGGRPNNPSSKQLIYLTIKAPKKLYIGDELAIYENKTEITDENIPKFISDKKRPEKLAKLDRKYFVYSFKITEDHVSQANGGFGKKQISVGQIFDVQIDPDTKQGVRVWLKKMKNKEKKLFQAIRGSRAKWDLL